jgi:hypothetical protein
MIRWLYRLRDGAWDWSPEKWRKLVISIGPDGFLPASAATYSLETNHCQSNSIGSNIRPIRVEAIDQWKT